MASDSDDLEAQLKRENPKGRLWERCAQLGVSAPRVRHRRVGDRHQVELVVDVDEWELSSGAQWAWSRKMAEQLAARELLEELDELRPKPARTAAREDDDVFDVDEDLAERLRSINPKGRAFEWTQRQKPPVARPRFEARREGSGMLVRARLDTLDLVTPWFRAGQRKLAEQAAAQALLPLLEQMSEQVDARTVLNELVQKGDLLSSSISVADSGLDLEDSRFRATAQLVSLDGSTTLAEAVGRSKRDAASKAARALLDCRAAADGAGPSGQWHASAMARARPAPPWWQTAPFVFVDEDGTTLGHARSAIGLQAGSTEVTFSRLSSELRTWFQQWAVPHPRRSGEDVQRFYVRDNAGDRFFVVPRAFHTNSSALGDLTTAPVVEVSDPDWWPPDDAD